MEHKIGNYYKWLDKYKDGASNGIWVIKGKDKIEKIYPKDKYYSSTKYDLGYFDDKTLWKYIGNNLKIIEVLYGN